jgi:hypothetical protein
VNIAERVKNIMQAVPATRSSDKELEIVYMQKAGMDLTPAQVNLFKQLPSMETIRRIRQKIQESGELLATPEVEKARFEKYKKTKGAIGVTNPVEAEELLDGTLVLPDGTKVLPYGK